MRTFSRKESARLLGVSVRTLGRWVADGRITAERSGTEQFAELRIGLDELQRVGLFIEPEPEPEPPANLAGHQPSPESDEPCIAELAIDPDPQPQPHRMADLAHPQPEPDPIEQRIAADLDFAAAYLSGEACDSYGNTVKGPRISDDGSICTALGPLPPQRRPKLDSCSHMDSRLIGDTTQPSADSPQHPLNAGFKGIEKKSSPESPNLQRNRLLHITLNEWLDAARAGYSR